MATKQYLKEFEEFLSQKEVESQDQPVIDYEQMKKEWLAKINEFYSLIQTFFYDYLQQGKIVKEWKTIQLSEEQLGEYEVQQLILQQFSIKLTTEINHQIKSRQGVDGLHT